MSLQELFTNPIVLGILATVITYAYLYWDNLEKQKKHPKLAVEPISMMTPLIVGLLVFVIAHNLFNKNPQLPAPTQTPLQNVFSPHQLQELGTKMQCNKFIEGTKIKNMEMIDSATYHLVGKNAIRLPQADVFIDLAKF
jgi:hypothetical protein